MHLDAWLPQVGDIADGYGLAGDAIGPGLEAFFAERPGLQHAMLERPWLVGDDTLEYAFSKTWTNADTGTEEVWKSYDHVAQRDKVERLVFADDGRLRRVLVEDVPRGGSEVPEQDLGSLLRGPDGFADPEEFKPAKKPCAPGIPDPKNLPENRDQPAAAPKKKAVAKGKKKK